MKRNYLLAFVLAGVLAFGSAPITVSAASPNAGGAIVGGQQAAAGDELTIGDDTTPLGAPEDQTPEGEPDDATPEETPEDAPEGTPEETPEDAPEGTPEEPQEDVSLEDDETPLAVLSSDAQPKGGFTWWGFTVGVLTTGVVGTGVWAVLKSRKKGGK